MKCLMKRYYWLICTFAKTLKPLEQLSIMICSYRFLKQGTYINLVTNNCSKFPLLHYRINSLSIKYKINVKRLYILNKNRNSAKKHGKLLRHYLCQLIPNKSRKLIAKMFIWNVVDSVCIFYKNKICPKSFSCVRLRVRFCLYLTAREVIYEKPDN